MEDLDLHVNSFLHFPHMSDVCKAKEKVSSTRDLFVERSPKLTFLKSIRSYEPFVVTKKFLKFAHVTFYNISTCHFFVECFIYQVIQLKFQVLISILILSFHI